MITEGLVRATPNTVIDGDGFYVSFNDVDLSIYGSETTALVLGQMEKFFILKGDHRVQYELLIPQGFDACFSYFRSNSQLHHHSDNIED